MHAGDAEHRVARGSLLFPARPGSVLVQSGVAREAVSRASAASSETTNSCASERAPTPGVPARGQRYWYLVAPEMNGHDVPPSKSVLSLGYS